MTRKSSKETVEYNSVSFGATSHLSPAFLFEQLRPDDRLVLFVFFVAFPFPRGKGHNLKPGTTISIHLPKVSNLLLNKLPSSECYIYDTESVFKNIYKINTT